MKCQKCNAIAGLYRVAGGAHYDDLDEYERETYSGRKITLDANGICQTCRPKRRRVPLFDGARPAPAGNESEER
jgi:hypothetical protein